MRSPPRNRRKAALKRARAGLMVRDLLGIGPGIGASPSGKAPDFDSGIPRFESWRPSHRDLGPRFRWDGRFSKLAYARKENLASSNPGAPASHNVRTSCVLTLASVSQLEGGAIATCVLAKQKPPQAGTCEGLGERNRLWRVPGNASRSRSRYYCSRPNSSTKRNWSFFVPRGPNPSPGSTSPAEM